MRRWKCIRGIVLPDPANRASARGLCRFLKGEVFEADEPADWLKFVSKAGVIVATEEPLSGPGRPTGDVWPTEPRVRIDGSVSEAEPETEEFE